MMSHHSSAQTRRDYQPHIDVVRHGCGHQQGGNAKLLAKTVGTTVTTSGAKRIVRPTFATAFKPPDEQLLFKSIIKFRSV
jgi:hypothetical protein